MKRVLILLAVATTFLTLFGCTKSKPVMTEYNGEKIVREDITNQLAEKFSKHEVKLPCSFGVHAPGAKEVYLIGDMTDWKDKLEMTDNGDGFFEISTRLKPGEWKYRYVIDGKEATDPGNPNTADDGKGGMASVATIYEIDKNLFYFEDVPHGKVEQISIKSNSLGETETFNVYTPPNYNSKKKYPLVIALHGYGSDHNMWTDAGLQNFMDNYINENKLTPFIVVMPNAGNNNYLDKSEEYIINELYPFIKENYSIYGTKDKTAITGQSMGGFGALNLAYRHQDIFGMTVPLMGAFVELDKLDSALDKNKPDLRISIYCGQDDVGVFPLNESLVEILKKHDIQHKYTVSPGDHSWLYIYSITECFLTDLSNFFSGKPL